MLSYCMYTEGRDRERERERERERGRGRARARERERERGAESLRRRYAYGRDAAVKFSGVR